MNVFPKLIFIFLLVQPFCANFSLILAQSLKPQDQIGLIWGGFEHTWSFNHRINRLGSFVYKSPLTNQSNQADTGFVCHASASGTGADSTLFTDYFSTIQADKVRFCEGMVVLDLDGREDRLVHQKKTIIIPAPAHMEGQEHYVCLLAGFDMRADQRADKLHVFKLKISDAQYAPASKELIFEIDATLVMNCQSPECPQFTQQSNYTLKVYYTIVGGSRADFTHTEHTLSQQYAWDTKIETQRPAQKHTFVGEKNPAYTQAALGIRGFSVILNEAHWMIQYQNNLYPLSYSPETGKMEGLYQLSFKEWEPEMKKYSVTPKHSRFSKRKKGWAILDMQAVLLQFGQATIRPQKQSGSLYWKGRNTNPDSPAALHQTPILLPTNP